MDRTDRKLADAREALTTLFELCDLSQPTDVERDAAIQRFEYSFETVWKSVQQMQSWLLGPCMSVSPHTAPEPGSPCHGRLALYAR